MYKISMSFLLKKNTITCGSVSSGRYACSDCQKNLQCCEAHRLKESLKNRGVIHDVPRYYGQFLGSCSVGLQITCLAQRHKSAFQSQSRLFAWHSFWHTRCNEMLFWL